MKVHVQFFVLSYGKSERPQEQNASSSAQSSTRQSNDGCCNYYKHFSRPDDIYLICGIIGDVVRAYFTNAVIPIDRKRQTTITTITTKIIIDTRNKR